MALYCCGDCWQTVKGGMEVQYRALVTVGNLHGVGGFAIGKAANPAEAITEASRCALICTVLLAIHDILLPTPVFRWILILYLHCAYTFTVPILRCVRKAKLLPNLIYVERYKQASLCHDVVGKHNGSKVSLKPYQSIE